MNDMLKDKVALITGASRGIGRATAIKLGSEGAKVAVNYLKNADAAAKVVDIINSNGGDAVAIQGDTSVREHAVDVVNRTLEHYGTIDILVNNAGITRDNLLMRMSQDDWQKVIDINLGSVFNCTQAVCRTMIKKRSGTIINIASVVGLTGNAGQANYAAAKAGIIGFTKAVAKELSSRGITVNAVAPGFIKTDMTDTLADSVKEQVLNNIPLHRFGEPEEVAELIAFLAGEGAKYITGQVINIDGGLVM
ncbi:3-oxoacyl-[acyl-carrier-protein] reductase [Mahella australiensis]|uniref:3-oxoacyl-[acyl-carrier-protein] reductase n=1 Tax=Mahella australiensis (strain DSM 15567 / CIP 107919 / 50-1 BON) TaxID=697281 RepID=F4A2R6_MAHA5|nr:3-oxoacyl-(acyl-carrier-protein) reductase [Mahella australiensis 50-1 BON]